MGNSLNYLPLILEEIRSDRSVLMEPDAAIEAIHKDGGLAVLAHPRTYNTFDQIEKYISWGLDGIEISHPSYQEGEVEKVLHYPLLHFGGSDSHGT